MDPVFVLIVAVIWVGAGVAAATMSLGRRGYRDRHWLVLGVVLGPLFVPVAFERGRREAVALERRVVHPDGASEPVPDSGSRGPDARPVVLVALDGSPVADRALDTAVALLSGSRGRIVLACVVGREVAEGDDPQAQRGAREMLEVRARRLGRDADVLIVSGQPADALMTAAEQCDADLVVVGRRGRGVSSRLLGSVATELARHSPRPVLLAPGDHAEDAAP
jgi:nucleotide-binding universal stress UspA family protein